MSEALCWLDLEMTGLHPERDVILELALYLTRMDLQFIAPVMSWTIHYDTLPPMDDWVLQHHTQSHLLDRVAESVVTYPQVEQQALEYIQQSAGGVGTIYLAGNTIYQDRRFLIRYMPNLNNRFHYRLVDVSTLKVLIKHWYPRSPFADFPKNKTHRAADDVLESCAELAHYRNHFMTML